MEPIGRRRLLATGLAAAAFPAVASAPIDARKLVLVHVYGGWDPTFCFDPKPGAAQIEGPERYASGTGDDVEEVRTFAGIPIMTNELRRPSVSRFFEAWADRCVVWNGISVGAIAHDPCTWRMLTGTMHVESPDLTVMSGVINGADLPLGAIDLSGASMTGRYAAYTGRIGVRNQIATLVDPEVTLSAAARTGQTWPQFVLDDDDEAAVRERLLRRAGTLGLPDPDGRIADFSTSIERARRLRDEAGDVLAGLPLGQILSRTQAIDAVVELLDRRVCASAMIDSGSPWDSHRDNSMQNGSLSELFTHLSYLVDALDGRGLLERTLVAVISEMGRTPKYNAYDGKDHWPHTSALLIGGGIAGGRVVGGTDDLQESLPIDPLTGAIDAAGTVVEYSHFAASILQQLDVDPEPWLPGSEPVGALA